MPRRSPQLILAIERATEARRIVARQQQLVEGLKASGKPTLEAEEILQLYVSALNALEDHERRLKEERKAKNRQSKKRTSE